MCHRLGLRIQMQLAPFGQALQSASKIRFVESPIFGVLFWILLEPLLSRTVLEWFWLRYLPRIKICWTT
jgi:hypothetical protein